MGAETGGGRRARWVKVFWVAAAVVAVDQLTKAWVVARLAPGESTPLWSPWLYVTHVENTGAAFGLLRSHSALLIVVAVAVLAAACIGRRRLAALPPLTRTAVAFGLGGTAGNLIDRLARGAVVDFIDVRVWPVFNVADTAIVAAAGLLIIATVRGT